MSGHGLLTRTLGALLFLGQISMQCVVPLAAGGCLRRTGEDSWLHYANGGMFNTRAPALAPNGEYLVYASACTGHGDIYSIKTGGAHPVRLTSSDDFESSPVFTPDGRRIVFIRESNQSRHIWIMDADGTDAAQVTEGNGLNDVLELSADGRFLLFTHAELSTGLGSAIHSYVKRIDKRLDKPECVGDIAAFSGDSRFVVYSDSGNLWRLELGDQYGSPHRVFGTGMPLDVSGDGKWVLVVRAPPGGQWTIDQEIWLVDIKNCNEKQIATGHSAVFLGANCEYILFFAGYEQTPYIVTTDDTKRDRIECTPGHKTLPRVCFNRCGVVIGSSLKNGRPEYDVMFIDPEDRRFRTIASIGCDKTTFEEVDPNRWTAIGVD